MNGQHLRQRARLLELLADEAVQGLEEVEHAEHAKLVRLFPELDGESFGRAAAAANLALLPSDEEPLPAALRARIEDDAVRMFAEPASEEPSGSPPGGAPTGTVTAMRRSGAWAGWVVAAAAVIAAVIVVLPDPAPLSPTPSAQRAELLQTAPDARRLAWTATDDPVAEGAAGDIVWSDARQEGYMRFRGLAANDPSVEQYQLWIFDAARDEARPVDGGVFDVPSAEGDVVVPIDPKLPVSRATLFAVTVERPGGVVVSSRERLPLLAKVPPAEPGGEAGETG